MGQAKQKQSEHIRLNPIRHGILIPPMLWGGGGFQPPHSSFCDEVFWGFDETTFKQYIIVGPMQKETARSSKLRTLSPFEIFGKILS